MKIINAKIEHQVSDLILSAAECVFKVYGLDQPKPICEYLYKNKNNKFSFENTKVLMIDEEVVGMIIVYKAEDELKLARNQEQLLHTRYQKMVKVVDNEAIMGTYYIDTLAISLNHMKKGYAQLLIKEIINEYKNVSLIVDVENNGAFMLYKKMGFKIVETVEMFGETFYKMKIVI